jgi:hypothetical protein
MEGRGALAAERCAQQESKAFFFRKKEAKNFCSFCSGSAP